MSADGHCPGSSPLSAVTADVIFPLASARAAVTADIHCHETRVCASGRWMRVGGPAHEHASRQPRWRTRGARWATRQHRRRVLNGWRVLMSCASPGTCHNRRERLPVATAVRRCDVPAVLVSSRSSPKDRRHRYFAPKKLTPHSRAIHTAFSTYVTFATSEEFTSHFLFQPIASSGARPQHSPALRGVVPLVTSRNGRPDPWRCWNFR